MTIFGAAVAEAVRDDARERHHPQVGFYLVRLGKMRQLVPARIWLCPHEPGEPGNLLDTGPILIGEIAGVPHDPLDVWCAHERRPLLPRPPLTTPAAEYRFACAIATHAREYEPREPVAAPAKRVDLTAIKPIGPER